MKNVYVDIYCGLGNQFFMYAMARALPNKNVYLHFFHGSDREFGLDHYPITLPRANPVKYCYHRIKGKILRRLEIYKKTLPRTFSTWDYYEPVAAGELEYLCGYWQNTRYFQDILPILRKEFTLKPPYTEKLQTAIGLVRGTNSVAIHVRRGDYLSKFCSRFFCNLSILYYQSAVAKITSAVMQPLFFIFSDDIPWCKQAFTWLPNAVFVDESCSDSVYDDFEIMRNCHHFIIANSTFSWWASYLSDTCPDKMILAPRRWFYDEAYNTRGLNGLSLPQWIFVDDPSFAEQAQEK